jgi:hypothetical protein
MTVAAAGTGGLMYWLAIYPIDQVKSAMMTDSIIKSERKYPTMASAFKVCHQLLLPLQGNCSMIFSERIVGELWILRWTL